MNQNENYTQIRYNVATRNDLLNSGRYEFSNISGAFFRETEDGVRIWIHEGMSHYYATVAYLGVEFKSGSGTVLADVEGTARANADAVVALLARAR